MTAAHWKGRMKNVLCLLKLINAASCKRQALIKSCSVFFLVSSLIYINVIIWHLLKINRYFLRLYYPPPISLHPFIPESSFWCHPWFDYTLSLLVSCQSAMGKCNIDLINQKANWGQMWAKGSSLQPRCVYQCQCTYLSLCTRKSERKKQEEIEITFIQSAHFGKKPNRWYNHLLPF